MISGVIRARMDPKAIAGRFGRDHMAWMVQPPAGWHDFEVNAQADLYAEMDENGGGRPRHAMGTRDPSAKKTMLDIADRL